MMELLTVIAILAVLVAIIIPVFSGYLEKSREAVDLANVRSAYSEVAVAVSVGDTECAVSFSLKDGAVFNWRGGKAGHRIDLKEDMHKALTDSGVLNDLAPDRISR